MRMGVTGWSSGRIRWASCLTAFGGTSLSSFLSLSRLPSFISDRESQLLVVPDGVSFRG